MFAIIMIFAVLTVICAFCLQEGIVYLKEKNKKGILYIVGFVFLTLSAIGLLALSELNIVICILITTITISLWFILYYHVYGKY